MGLSGRKNMVLANRLKRARLDKMMAVREVAKLVRCSTPHLYGIENGSHRPSIRLLARLGKVLGFRVFEMMEGIDR